MSLFPEADTHDPGGKVKTKLPAGMIGEAGFFGARREYRLWLSRWWGTKGGSYVLWIGMNPSTASAEVNDPTVTREVIYTRRHFQVDGYVKCNVMDYRATHPRQLLDQAVKPRSSMNIGYIKNVALDAQKVIVCWGALHKKLRIHAEVVMATLEAAGVETFCVGMTQDGSPRHPLYVRSDATIQPYKRMG